MIYLQFIGLVAAIYVLFYVADDAPKRVVTAIAIVAFIVNMFSCIR